MGKRVLVVGGGGREHALAWRLARDDQVDEVLVAPGNGGTGTGKISSVKAGGIEELAALARERRVGLTVVGPEALLAEGIADAFGREGLPLLGPGREAARIESSKAHAKEFMRRHGIATAAGRTCTTHDEAAGCLDEFSPPYVIKADGLAAGKGVVIAGDRSEAERAVKSMLAGLHGDASRTIVIEEHLAGIEMSLIALCDGSRYAVLGTSQDHKRLGDGDAGPNTGGMGAVSPAPFAADLDVADLARRTIEPVVRGLADERIIYRGFLYAGLMLGADGSVRVLEYNCRLGDPEAQVLLPLWEGDCLAALAAAAAGELAGADLPWSDRAAVGVVMAAPGYPVRPETGIELAVPDPDDGCVVFHAGTRRDGDGNLFSSGGRVLNVIGIDSDIASARRRAYAMVDRIGFAGAQIRRDIAAGG